MIIERGKMTNVKDILDFLTAGNAKFTLVSTQTTQRLTFYIAESKVNPKRLKVYSIFNKREPLGYINLDLESKQFTRTRNGTYVEAFNWFWKGLMSSTHWLHLPRIVEFWHEGKCGRCGRQLTVPESIKTGIGPECKKFIETERFMQS